MDRGSVGNVASIGNTVALPDATGSPDPTAQLGSGHRSRPPLELLVGARPDQRLRNDRCAVEQRPEKEAAALEESDVQSRRPGAVDTAS